MPLFPPVTDTLRWDDLVREGRSLLPLVAPDWTDQNASDPGIALLELIAWLVETDSYRSGAVSDRERRLLLALAGFSPSPPRAARCLVQVTVAAPGPVAAPLSARLPAGHEFEGERDGDVVPFTLVDDVVVTGATIGAVAWTAAGGAPHDRTACADLTRARAAGRAIEPFGPDPRRRRRARDRSRAARRARGGRGRPVGRVGPGDRRLRNDRGPIGITRHARSGRCGTAPTGP